MERLTVIETLYGAYYTISTANDVFTIISKQEELGQDEVSLMCCDYDVINNSIFEFKNHRVTTIKINEIGYIGIKYIEDGYVLNKIEYNFNRIRREKEKKINKVKVRDFLAIENTADQVEVYLLIKGRDREKEKYISIFPIVKDNPRFINFLIRYSEYFVERFEVYDDYERDEYYTEEWDVLKLYITRGLEMDFVLGRLAQNIREEYNEFYDILIKDEYGRMFYYFVFDRVSVLLEVDDYYIYLKPRIKKDDELELLGTITINNKGNFLEKLDILRANFEMFKEL